MNILVPTDFSKYATYAFDAACQIALSTESNLHLYHSANIPDDWEDLDVTDKANDTTNRYIVIETRQKLMALKDTAQELGVKCDIHYTGGKFLDNIIEIFTKVNIDLVVMGSHGVSGKEEWFIGSNTQKVVRKFYKDLIVIKEPTPVFKPKSAVFVSSLNIEDQDAFRTFLNYTDAFNITEVHVLTIDTSSWFTQPYILVAEAQKDFRKIAEGRNCITHFYKHHSVQSGISDFIKNQNIDLTAISYRTRNPIKRIFLGSNVEMFINHTDRPVLCINS